MFTIICPKMHMLTMFGSPITLFPSICSRRITQRFQSSFNTSWNPYKFSPKFLSQIKSINPFVLCAPVFNFPWFFLFGQCVEQSFEGMDMALNAFIPEDYVRSHYAMIENDSWSKISSFLIKTLDESWQEQFKKSKLEGHYIAGLFTTTDLKKKSFWIVWLNRPPSLHCTLGFEIHCLFALWNMKSSAFLLKMNWLLLRVH